MFEKNNIMIKEAILPCATGFNRFIPSTNHCSSTLNRQLLKLLPLLLLQMSDGHTRPYTFLS